MIDSLQGCDCRGVTASHQGFVRCCAIIIRHGVFCVLFYSVCGLPLCDMQAGIVLAANSQVGNRLLEGLSDVVQASTPLVPIVGTMVVILERVVHVEGRKLFM